MTRSTTEANFNNFYGPIGKVASAWAMVEETLTNTLIWMMGADMRFAYPVIHQMSSSSKIQHIRKQLELHDFDSKHKIKLKKLLNKLDSLRTKRNESVHTTWLILNEEDGKYSAKTKKAKKPGEKKEWITKTDSELTVLATEITSVGTELNIAVLMDLGYLSEIHKS